VFLYFITSLIDPLLAQCISSKFEGRPFRNIIWCTDRQAHAHTSFVLVDKYWRTPAVANRTAVSKHRNAARTKARKLNIKPVCVGAHLYQPVELDYKSIPWTSDNVMILNSLALGLSHIAEPLKFPFRALIFHTHPQWCSDSSFPPSISSVSAFIYNPSFLPLSHFIRLLVLGTSLIRFMRLQYHRYNCYRL